MTHGPMLLSAIASVDGEALVLHPGDIPYIVTPGGRVSMSSHPLTVEQLTSLIEEFLPRPARATLEESGAVQWELPPSAESPEGRFVVVAAHLEEELWAEVRRYPPASAPRPAHRAGQPGAGDDLNLPSASELWPANKPRLRE